MKSNRYRFWRMLSYIVLGGLLGFMTGYVSRGFDLAVLPYLTLDWTMIHGVLSLLGLLFFCGVCYYWRQTRKKAQLLAALSDDEAVEQMDKAVNVAYGIANILAGVLMIICHGLLGISLTIMVEGNGSVLIFMQVGIICFLALVSSRLIRLAFKDVHGQEMPKNLSLKEFEQFSLSMMDEAEKQVQYEENFFLVMRLAGYIFPGTYIFLYTVRMLLGLDILLTIVVITVIYIYILMKQYQIIKHYYK